VLPVATDNKLGTGDSEKSFYYLFLYHDGSRNITQQLIKTNWHTQ